MDLILTILKAINITNLFSGFIGSIIGAVITWKATKFLIREQEKPIFTLIFKITNKNLEAFPIKIGIKNLGGIAKNVRWYLKGDIPYYNSYDKGDIPVIGRDETRFLFDLDFESYKNIKSEDKTFDLVIEFLDGFNKTNIQKIPIDLYKMGNFEIVIDPDNRDLIELSKNLNKEARKEFKVFVKKEE